MAKQPFDLAAMLGFIKQPQAQAQPVDVRSLMLPYPGQQGGAERRYKERQASLMAEKADEIYGTPGSETDVHRPDPESPFGSMNVETERVRGTGMYDETVPQKQRMMEMNKRMLGAGTPGYARQWSQNQGNMQNASMSNLGSMEREQYKVMNPGLSSAGKMARDAGFVEGTPDFEKFVTEYAKKTDYEAGLSKPLSTGDLTKWMTPQGRDIPAGSSMADIRDNNYVLRNKASGEAGGKIAMLDTALQQLPIIHKYIDNEDGSMNTSLLAQMWAEDQVGLAKIFTSSEAQEMYAAFETGMQAITRTETGAAMAKEEIENTKKRFMPHPLATDAANRQKLKAYEYFLTNAIDLLDPTGRGNSGLTPQEIMDKAVNTSMSATGAVETKREPNPVGLAEGTVSKGYRFKGGDPNNQSNWEKVQ